MRFTKNLCAIVSSVAVVTSAHVWAQAPAPAANDDQVRDALRKALDNQPPAPAAPSTTAPVTPVAPAPAPVTPAAVTPVPPAAASQSSVLVPPPTDPIWETTNVISVSLSLDEAIRLALVHNLTLQVERYTPIIAEYDWRSLYGAYDPLFSAGIRRDNNTREPGGLNLNTGNTTPGTRSRTYLGNLGLAGLLPSGTTYEISEFSRRNKVTTPDQIGTNSFGQPVFIKNTDTTWDSSAVAARLLDRRHPVEHQAWGTRRVPQPARP